MSGHSNYPTGDQTPVNHCLYNLYGPQYPLHYNSHYLLEGKPNCTFPCQKMPPFNGHLQAASLYGDAVGMNGGDSSVFYYALPNTQLPLSEMYATPCENGVNALPRKA